MIIEPYFSAEVLTKIAENPGCEIRFGDVARGTVDGVDQDGIIVRMKNSANYKNYEGMRRNDG